MDSKSFYNPQTKKELKSQLNFLQNISLNLIDEREDLDTSQKILEHILCTIEKTKTIFQNLPKNVPSDYQIRYILLKDTYKDKIESFRLRCDHCKDKSD